MRCASPAAAPFPLRNANAKVCPALVHRWARELLLAPVVVAKGDKEAVKIESSVNSLRVSIKIKQMDNMERILVDRFSSFLMMRADDFVVLRRKAMEGFDISFLITNFNAEKMWRNKLVDFIVTFIQEINSEISELRLSVNSRGRKVAEQFFGQFVLKG